MSKLEIINGAQAGFRKGFSTSDNIFIIHCLINTLFSRKCKLFCAFIDFKGAFDNVWRAGLWKKLLDCNLNGKCFNLIKNMYSNIKSCVSVNGSISEYFSSTVGVRQGENLSPLLFAFYLNDLEDFLIGHDVSGVSSSSSQFDNDIVMFIKLFLLLYADDTVLISESAEDLQVSLNAFEQYCTKWKLTVNIDKTKVVIFSKGRLSTKYNFHFQDVPLDIVKEYKYLGIFLSKSGSFFSTKKYIANQAKRATYSLINKVRNLSLPVDLQIELFEKTVKPILLYGCEIWGFGNIDVIEQVQLRFFKYLFNLKTTTPNYMIYGEFGIFPIKIDIYTRMITFWGKLVETQNSKLSSLVYKIVFSMYNHSNFNSDWIGSIRNILIECGLPYIWDSQEVFSIKWLKSFVKQKLKDIFINEWTSKVNESTHYKLFKTTFKFETYFKKLTDKESKLLLKFRTRNHRLPVEVGRWNKIELRERKCVFCKNDIGDEYHYILICPYLKLSRKQYINPYYFKRPNTIKFFQLMNSGSKKELKQLCKFVKLIMKLFVT